MLMPVSAAATFLLGDWLLEALLAATVGAVDARVVSAGVLLALAAASFDSLAYFSTYIV